MRTLIILLLSLPLCAQSLRDLAAARGIHIGAAVAPAHFTEPLYASTLAREFDQVEPENAMKFGPIHPSQDTYNFGPADAIVDFAKSHNMLVRGHTLVWHQQIANWVKAVDRTPAQLSEILHDHIENVVSHYAGQVYAWDVANEAFESDGSYRKTTWSDTPDTLAKAFQWAHAADPKALLFYNDYSAETLNKKSDAIYEMAKDLKSRGIPIDGIGLQMHVGLKPPNLEGIAANIKRLTGLGLQVQITELDVKLPTGGEDLEAQAKVYHDLVAICVANPRCTAIQIWGFTDRYSWIPGSSKGFGAALPFDRDYQPKPAYQGIAAALAR